MNIIPLSTPYYTPAKKRVPPLGIVLHDTESDGVVAPHSAGSWHYEVGRNGEVTRYVYAAADGIDLAWHVRACDEWRPPWMQQRDSRVSEANSCTCGIEIVSSAKWRAAGEPYTQSQYVALRDLLGLLYGFWGRLPIVTHGAMQLDRTDPVSLDMARAGLVAQADGYRYTPDAAVTPEPPVEEEDMANQGIIDELSHQVADLKAEVAGLHGLGAERDGQIADLRQEIAGKDSTIGALEHDKIAPLEARVAQMEAQLRDAIALAGKATAQRPTRIELQYVDGSLGYVPEPAA